MFSADVVVGFLVIVFIVGVVVWTAIVSTKTCSTTEGSELVSHADEDHVGDAYMILNPTPMSGESMGNGDNSRHQLYLGAWYRSTPGNVDLFSNSDLESLAQIQIGDSFAVAIDKDGKAWIWGDHPGLYGDERIRHLRPMSIKAPRQDQTWTDVSVNGQQCLLLDNAGRIYGIGINTNRFVSHSQEAIFSDPQLVSNSRKYKSVHMGGGDCAAAIGENGRLYTWGSNTHGRVGNGEDNEHVQELPTLYQVDGIENCKTVSISETNVVALTEDGKLYSWGAGIEDADEKNVGGLLAADEAGAKPQGDSFNDYSIRTPVEVTTAIAGEVSLASDETWDFVSLRNQVGVAITSEGRVFLWGLNDPKVVSTAEDEVVYQLTLLDTSSFENVKFKDGYGLPHGFILRDTDNHIYTSGRNFVGQLGQEGKDVTIDPEAGDVEALAQVGEITVDFLSSYADQKSATVCGLVHVSASNTNVIAWGVNRNLRLGIQAGWYDKDVRMFVKCPTYTNAIDIALGERHIFWTNADGNLMMNSTYEDEGWADDMRGESYDPDDGKLVDEGDWTMVSTPSWNNAVDDWFVGLKDKKVFVWGETSGANDSLFNSITEGEDSHVHDAPTAITNEALNAENAVDVKTAVDLIIVLTESGKLYSAGAWRGGARGHLDGGQGDFTDFDEIPHPDEKKWTKVSCGIDHAAAIDEDGKLWAWGDAGHMVLHNVSASTHVPQQVLFEGQDTTHHMNSKWVEVSAGDQWTMAMNEAFGDTDAEETNYVFTWGRNKSHQTGQGGSTSDVIESPRRLWIGSHPSIKIRHILAKGNRGYLLDHNRYLYAWGDNENQFLGTGSLDVSVARPLASIGVRCHFDRIMASKSNAIARNVVSSS